jgi:putative ABC transport system ATP-binding protein
MLIDGVDLSLIYDLDKEYETYALRNLNIGINEGEMVGIMGPSGSGKSSLLYVLSGLKSPTMGTVYYRNMDFEAYTEQKKAELRRNHFGFIFQRHFLIEYLSVFDNVLLAGTEKDLSIAKEKTLSLLEKMNMKKFINKKPAHLSGGQRQRVAIARALINNPDIIFADEPTASLDHKNAREIMDILEEHRGNTSIIIVTHDKTILENADRVLEMWDGCIK